MRIKLLLLTACVLACVVVGLSLRPAETTVSAQAGGTVCVQATAPLVTHGTTAIPPLLPNGDFFLLSGGLNFVASSAPAGATAGVVTAANFGGLPSTAGNFGFTGTSVPFFANSTPNSTLSAVSCVDNLWDINFAIATTGSTTGDVVLVSLVSPGGAVTNLVQFTINGNNAQLTGLISSGATVFNNNILANTASLNPGDNIGLGTPAGTAGMRTNQITIALSPATMGCNRVRFDIIRPAGAGAGTTSVAITSVVVTRANTTTATGTGLLAQFGGGLTGTFPTGVTCDPACPPPCPPPSNVTLMCPFRMLCFHTPGFYCAGNVPFTATTVRIPQINFGFPIAVRTFGVISPSVNRYLGCYQYYFETFGPNASAARRLTAYYIAAQFTIDNADSISPLVNLAEQVSVGCYIMPPMAGAPPLFPVTLSNGVTINADTKLCILFSETESAIIQMRTADINKLIAIYQAFTTCEQHD